MALLFVGSTSLFAGGPPELTGISPLGAQRGSKANITFYGKGLVADPDTTVDPCLNFPGDVKLLEAKSTYAVVQIALKSDAPLGLYPVRFRTRDGLSGRVYFAVGLYRDLKVEPAAAQLQGQAVVAPLTLNGEIGPAQQNTFTVAMKAGQRLVAEVEASRLRVDIDAVLEVFDPAGHKIAWNDDSLGLGSDARVDFRAKSAGTYRIVIHDATYKKGGRYRLKIGDYPYAVGMTPPGGESGDRVRFLGGSASDSLSTTFAATASSGDWLWTMVPQPYGDSAALPLRFELHPDSGGSSAQPLASPELNPVVLFDAIDSKSSERTHSIRVKAGVRYSATIERARPVSRIMPTVLVKGSKDAVLAQAEGEGDQPLQVNFMAPAGCDQVQIAVSDSMGRRGLETAYSISVARELPSFDVFIDNPTLNIPKKGVEIVRLRAVRRGYSGPIQVQLREWLNDSMVEVTGGLIEANETEGLLAVAAKPYADKSIPALTLRALGGPASQPIEVRVTPDPKLANPYATDGGTAEEIACTVCRERPVSVKSKVRKVTVLHGLPTEIKFDVVRSSEAKDTAIDLKIENVREFRDELKELKIPKEQSTAVLKIPGKGNLPVAKRLLVLQGNATIGGEEWPVKVQPIILDFQRPYSLEVLTPDIPIPKNGKGVIEGVVRRAAPFAGEVEIRVEDLPRGLTAAPVTLKGDRAIVQLPIAAAETPVGVYSIKLTAATAMGGAKRTKDYVLPPVEVTIRVGEAAKPADMPARKAKAARKPAAKKEA